MRLFTLEAFGSDDPSMRKTESSFVLCHIGQVLMYENIRDIIKFCAQEKLVLFADEVYQETMYKKDVTFHSCRKVVKDLGPEYRKFQLMSINSVSKGFYGELVHLIITA